MPGAAHIPFWKVGTRLDEVPSKKNEPLVVYCGSRAARVARRRCRFGRYGFKNIIVR